MKPRVFVSSTYYDLKYIRENLERYIYNYGFEPVLFESGNVTYEHNTNIDVSCYSEVKLCHMMILIIGGRYGSIASDTTEGLNLENYERNYVSITRNEYETAITKNMPVFIFVDKNVYSDYQTFTENKKLLEKESAFRFAHVDSLNIFRFLDFVIKKPIKTFEKYEEIEDYLRIQFSGLFYLYLEQLQRKKEDERIIDTISELNNVTQRMNEMIKEVGKKVIDENEYKKVTEKQNSLLLEFFVQTLGDNMRIESNNKEDLSKDECEKLAIKLYEYLNNSELKQKYDKSDFKEFTILSTVLSRKLGEEFLTINPLVKLKDINGYQTNVRFNTNIKPIIKNDKTMKFERQLMEHLTRLMDSKTSTFPF